MNTSGNQRCNHPACTCAVSEGDAYCSEHCRKRVESPTSSEPEGCRCGHPDCAGTRASASDNGKTS